MRTGQVVVDGATYHWRVEEDWRNYSLDFSHRGVSYEDICTITGGEGFEVKFLEPFYDVGVWGWWRDRRYVTAEVVERAVRIVLRTGTHELAGALVEEAMYGPRRSLAEDLAAAAAVLGTLDTVDRREELVVAWLAIGSTTHDRDAQLAIDDWIASHADQLVGARPQLQSLLEQEGTELHVYSNRSALVFLSETCARLNVELGLDARQVDAALAKRPAYPKRPWGMPKSHWWWRQGKTTDYDRPRDPYDDD